MGQGGESSCAFDQTGKDWAAVKPALETRPTGLSEPFKICFEHQNLSWRGRSRRRASRMPDYHSGAKNSTTVSAGRAIVLNALVETTTATGWPCRVTVCGPFLRASSTTWLNWFFASWSGRVFMASMSGRNSGQSSQRWLALRFRRLHSARSFSLVTTLCPPSFPVRTGHGQNCCALSSLSPRVAVARERGVGAPRTWKERAGRMPERWTAQTRVVTSAFSIRWRAEAGVPDAAGCSPIAKGVSPARAARVR